MCCRHPVTISEMKFTFSIICHFVLWNVIHWKLHILILTWKFGFLFIMISHSIIKKYTGTNPNVAACLTPSTHELFLASLSFVGVAKLIIILLDIVKSAGVCCSSILLLLWSLNKLVDVLETVWELLVADMSIDEWSIDAEGKYSLKTTVYSPVVSSYMSNNPTWKRRWLLTAFKQPAASHSLHHGDRERQQTRLPRHSSFKRTWRPPHHQRIQEPTHTDQYLAYDSHHPQSVKRGIVKYLRKNMLSVLVSNGYPFSFLQKLTKTGNRRTVANPPTSSKLLRFYLMSKVCRKSFAVAYNNEVCALFSSQRRCRPG